MPVLLSEDYTYPLPELCKVQQIFDSQLQEAVYRKYCKVVIDNNGTVEDAIRQIDLAITNMENE